MVSRQDPFRTQTAIGEIGRIKTSQRIEMRVDPDSDGNVPDLLHLKASTAFTYMGRGLGVSRWTCYGPPTVA